MPPGDHATAKGASDGEPKARVPDRTVRQGPDNPARSEKLLLHATEAIGAMPVHPAPSSNANDPGRVPSRAALWVPASPTHAENRTSRTPTRQSAGVGAAYPQEPQRRRTTAQKDHSAEGLQRRESFLMAASRAVSACRR